MKHATMTLQAPAFNAHDAPRELSRALLEARFPVVLEVRCPWRARRRDRLCDLMAVDAAMRQWWVAAIEPRERLPVLLHLMTDRKLARQVAAGDRVQLHCWTRRNGGLVVEVVELTAEDFS